MPRYPHPVDNPVDNPVDYSGGYVQHYAATSTSVVAAVDNRPKSVDNSGSFSGQTCGQNVDPGRRGAPCGQHRYLSTGSSTEDPHPITPAERQKHRSSTASTAPMTTTGYIKNQSPKSSACGQPPSGPLGSGTDHRCESRDGATADRPQNASRTHVCSRPVVSGPIAGDEPKLSRSGCRSLVNAVPRVDIRRETSGRQPADGHPGSASADEAGQNRRLMAGGRA
jgi:hypothetical protein